MDRLKKIISMLCFCGLLSASFIGCGSEKSMDEDYISTFNNEKPVEYYDEASGVEDNHLTDDVYGSDSGTGAAVNVQEQTNRKLIKTVNLDVETKEYDNLLSTLQKKITALGGYIENYTSSGVDDNRYASITARVPSEKLEDFVNIVDQESNITYRNEYVDDVTLTYVDLESHKKMLKAEEDRLLALMEQAETMEDMISIENAITDVRYKLDSMESQLRTYDNQIDYSTVNLNIDEVAKITPQTPKSTIDRIKSGFVENVFNVGNGIKNFVVEIIINLPYIVVFAIILLLIFGIVKISRKHHKIKAEKMQNEAYKYQMNQSTYVPQNTNESTNQNASDSSNKETIDK